MSDYHYFLLFAITFPSKKPFPSSSKITKLFYDSRFAETPISSPDYIKIAEAYGLEGYRVHNRREIKNTIRKAKLNPGPVIIEFVVEKHDVVYPMVPTGAALNAMINRPEKEEA